jgi:hypothetical protein
MESRQPVSYKIETFCLIKMASQTKKVLDLLWKIEDFVVRFPARRCVRKD